MGTLLTPASSPLSILSEQTRPRKPVRMLSGVHVVTVAMMPSYCPHGKCIYCPGGLDQGTPQSYILNSPVVRTALPLGYHPYLQVNSRITQYRKMGHQPSKIELIIIGGTFSAYDPAYQEWFVTQCLEALNRFPDPNPPKESTLCASQTTNELANLRCVGMTVETRPDSASQSSADSMLTYGVTRVELGVQTVFDDVLRRVGRAHSSQDVKHGTQILRDSGFKICYHMMLGLPGMDPGSDLDAFEAIFEDPAYKPDMIKIYPTLVLRGTALFNLWKSGRYEPYSDQEIADLIVEVKRKIPPWVRINRIQREIPSKDVVAGLTTTNLRGLVEEKMHRLGISCPCIRCREIGHAKEKRSEYPTCDRDFELTHTIYDASGGVEIFLSFEDKRENLLAGFLRLRIPSTGAHRREFHAPTAVVRELHIYGSSVPVGSRVSEGVQHRGWGARLLVEAEQTARSEFGCKQIAVISGIGVREYYRGRGYERRDHSPYMLKELADN